jgi:hypothetical protein
MAEVNTSQVNGTKTRVALRLSHKVLQKSVGPWWYLSIQDFSYQNFNRFITNFFY